MSVGWNIFLTPNTCDDHEKLQRSYWFNLTFTHTSTMSPKILTTCCGLQGFKIPAFQHDSWSHSGIVIVYVIQKTASCERSSRHGRFVCCSFFCDVVSHVFCTRRSFVRTENSFSSGESFRNSLVRKTVSLALALLSIFCQLASFQTRQASCAALPLVNSSPSGKCPCLRFITYLQNQQLLEIFPSPRGALVG